MKAEHFTNEFLAAGQIIREPPGSGRGYWAGAPGVFYAADENAFYLTYRIRRPRGVHPDRGGEARIARSIEGRGFEDIWAVHKDQLGTASIERCAIRRGADGQWRYFICFVDPADGRWCVSIIKAASPREFDPARAQRLFSGAALGLEGVKDPWIMEQRGIYYMFLSVALPTPKTRRSSHDTLDIFNTGECVSATGLAISSDLDRWDWQGVVFAPGDAGWDRYCRRINSVIPYHGKFLAFYDGSASHAENYEEKTGLAISSDLQNWKSSSAEGPALTSPRASGSLRYLDAQTTSEGVFLFYEWARPDGAHDLRLAKLDAGSNGFDGLVGTVRLD